MEQSKGAGKPEECNRIRPGKETNLKQPLWYGCPSAISCSMGYTVFVQTLHFVCVPENVAIPAGFQVPKPPLLPDRNLHPVPPGPSGPRRILAQQPRPYPDPSIYLP